ncbi:MAG: hypothetical protein CBD74_14015 [Saprospirales bacterium TMED214]|nr:MAG: hypothetical protein CBD74_14015 [Saprospirales bacterium TMED214]
MCSAGNGNAASVSDVAIQRRPVARFHASYADTSGDLFQADPVKTARLQVSCRVLRVLVVYACFKWIPLGLESEFGMSERQR